VNPVALTIHLDPELVRDRELLVDDDAIIFEYVLDDDDELDYEELIVFEDVDDIGEPEDVVLLDMFRLHTADLEVA